MPGGPMDRRPIANILPPLEMETTEIQHFWCSERVDFSPLLTFHMVEKQILSRWSIPGYLIKRTCSLKPPGSCWWASCLGAHPWVSDRSQVGAANLSQWRIFHLIFRKWHHDHIARPLHWNQAVLRKETWVFVQYRGTLYLTLSWIFTLTYAQSWTNNKSRISDPHPATTLSLYFPSQPNFWQVFTNKYFKCKFGKYCCLYSLPSPSLSSLASFLRPPLPWGWSCHSPGEPPCC